MRRLTQCGINLPFSRGMVGALLAAMLLPAQVVAQPHDICTWRPVQNAGINSHQKGPPWCQPGEFMTAFDLDGPRKSAAHDSPVVGQAYCCTNGRRSIWTRVDTWKPVWQARPRVNSHNPLPRYEGWCAPGSFIVALDLDGPRDLSAHESPVVGAVLCAYRDQGSRWRGDVFSREVEKAGYNSHQPYGRWCPEGSYLIAFDQDSRPRYAPHDSPVIGEAQCAEP